MEAYASNPSTQEDEAEKLLQVWGQSSLLEAMPVLGTPGKTPPTTL